MVLVVTAEAPIATAFANNDLPQCAFPFSVSTAFPVCTLYIYQGDESTMNPDRAYSPTCEVMRRGAVPQLRSALLMTGFRFMVENMS